MSTSNSTVQAMYDTVYAAHLQMEHDIQEKKEEIDRQEQELEKALAEEKEKGKDVQLASVSIGLQISSAKMSLATLQMKALTRQQQLASVKKLMETIKE